MAAIGGGFVVLLGVGRDDSEADADFLVDRILGLRVFADTAATLAERGFRAQRAGESASCVKIPDQPARTQWKNLKAVDGELLVVSQFTLYADTSQRRPSFSAAAPPEQACRLYDYFLSQARKRGVKVECGEFGAHMEIDLVNDGPVTIILDSASR